MAEQQGSYRKTEIGLLFGDGSYLFRFGLKQFAEHDEKCGPIGACFARVLQGRLRNEQSAEDLGFPTHAAYSFRDLYETVRLGLIGGGQGVVAGEMVKVGPIEAMRLVDRYVAGQPLEDSWKIAAVILMTVCQGYEEKRFEPVLPGEEDDAEEEAATGRSRRGKKKPGASTTRKR